MLFIPSLNRITLGVYLLTLSILFIPLSQFAQTLEGGVLGPENEKIAYVHIYLKHAKTGTTTDTKGEFNLPFSKTEKDTLVIKAIGFQTLYFPANRFTPGNTAVIYMQPLDELLNEIETTATSFKRKTLNKKKPSIRGVYSFDHNNEIVTFIDGSEKNWSGFIKNVSVHISNMDSCHILRLHLYDRNVLTAAPENELLNESILLEGPYIDEWVTLSLEHLNIPIPENGYFAGVESIRSSHCKTNEIQFKEPHIIAPPAQTEAFSDHVLKTNFIYISSYSQSYPASKSKRGKMIVWHKDFLGVWKKNRYSTGTSKPFAPLNPAIRSQILYSKKQTKKLNKFDKLRYKSLKKKELLTLFETIPEVNTDRYPQSSIEELLGSICGSIVEKNYAYAYTYLSVFNSDSKKDLAINNPKGIKEEQQTCAYILENIEDYKITQIDTDKYELQYGDYTIQLMTENNLWYILAN